MTRSCHHCGCNVDRDELIEIDGFRFDPRGTADYRGMPLKLTPAQSILLGSIARQAPRPATYAMLIGQMGIDGADEQNVLKVQASNVRRRLEAHGVPSPIKTVWGVGYQWKGVP